jgi:hypothetical protein
MAHFARVENGFVVDMHVVNNDVIIDESGIESEEIGQQFLSGLWGGEPADYVQCSYNSNPINGVDRGPYPSGGYVWDGSMFADPLHVVDGSSIVEEA